MSLPQANQQSSKLRLPYGAQQLFAVAPARKPGDRLTPNELEVGLLAGSLSNRHDNCQAKSIPAAEQRREKPCSKPSIITLSSFQPPSPGCSRWSLSLPS